MPALPASSGAGEPCVFQPGSRRLARSDASPGDCCVCVGKKPTLVALCGCAYHSQCLQDYWTSEGQSFEICCHLHKRPLGSKFLSQHVSGCTLRPTAKQRLGSSQPSVGQMEAASEACGPAQTCARRTLTLAPGGGTRRPGNLGASLGVPCAICFGEDGVMKTLHCTFKVHTSCLKEYWRRNVEALGCFVELPCPAGESAGCEKRLTSVDLEDVLEPRDLAWADDHVRRMDASNAAAVKDLRQRSLAVKRRPTFHCAICLTDHEVDGSCTLPCEHRFCYEALQYHFESVVKDRRLGRLVCPVPDCGFSLRGGQHIQILQECLPEPTFQKLLHFLALEDPHLCDCRYPGCEERVFLESGDQFVDLCCPQNHRFCARCDLGPHRGKTCEERQQQQAVASHLEQEAWKEAIAMGWKPCPMRCRHGGGFKASDECDHVTCQCGFEFCWDCGVCRQIPLNHDNRWHKPACRYHTKYTEVSEKPRRAPKCPECKQLPPGYVCAYPKDDRYPESYMRGGVRDSPISLPVKGTAEAEDATLALSARPDCANAKRTTRMSVVQLMKRMGKNSVIIEI